MGRGPINIRHALLRSRPVWGFAVLLALLAALMALNPLPTFAKSAPDTPSAVNVSRTDGTVAASWNAPTGATKYHVTYSSNGGASWSLAAFGHTSTSISISVDNAKSYIVAVRAGNDNGWSGWRNSASIAPYATAPGAVASVSLTRTDGTVAASWNAPTGATKYHVTYSSNGGASWSLAAFGHTSTSISISVDNAKSYIVAVRAGNDNGWSGWRNSASIAPYATAPGAVASVSLTRTDGTVAASWNAPNGATKYHVTYSSNGGASWSLAAFGHTSTSISISVDNAKSYIVAVRAGNDNGWSGWRNSAAAEAFSAPGAPTNVAVDPDNDSLEITWDAVTGATGYDVRAKTENASGWHDVAGGVTGTSYTYSTTSTMDWVGVRARNGVNASSWSDVGRLPSNELLPTATGLSSGGASAESGPSAQSVASLASQLAKPSWGNIKRYITRGQYNSALDLNWTGVNGATGYNLVCSHAGWYWYLCGWDDDGTVTFTSVPSAEGQPVTVSHYRRGSDSSLSPGDYTPGPSRTFMLSIRAVNADPAQASDWVNTPIMTIVRPYLFDFAYTRGDGQITMSWKPFPHATGYDIYCDNYTPGPTYDPDYTLCATLTGKSHNDPSHSVTISTWTDDGSNYAIDNTSTLDIKIHGKNQWSEERTFVPLIPPNPPLGVSNVGVTTATLNITGHSTWYYKANAAPDNTCKGPVSGASKDLTGLSANTSYTYSAYSDSACTTDNRLATAAAFTTLASISNLASARAGDSSINNVLTKQAVAFTTGSANSGGYVLKDVTLPLKNTSGSGGLAVTLHQMQGSGQYSSTSAPSTTVLATLSGTAPTSSSYTDTTWSCSGSGCDLDPGATYFIVASRTASANYDWKYAQTENESAQPSDNGWGIAFAHDYLPGYGWTSTSTQFNLAELVFAYAPNLVSSAVTASGATLTISNYTGSWYYKATSGPHTTCQGPASGNSVTLSGLTGSTSYTYSAYSDSGCTAANELATAPAFTTSTPPPSPPTSLNLSFNSGILKMQGTWSRPAGFTGSITYEVEHADSDRSNPYGSRQTVTSSDSTVTHTFNNSLTIKFRVRTKIGSATSAWAEYVS